MRSFIKVEKVADKLNLGKTKHSHGFKEIQVGTRYYIMEERGDKSK